MLLRNHLFTYMRTELLAPAGSLAGLKAVIAAGADAVYVGGTRFGARAYADNPGEEDLLYGIDYAHLRGAKVYMTVNTLLKEEEMDSLCSYMEPYVRCGLDAVLVQDFGVLMMLREAFPDLPLHASTQMTVTGPEGAALLRDYGVTRVVPARELSLRELIRIKEISGLEVETFVHGALCYCYSGACLMSSMIGGRSGNRGRCAQPCRLLNLLNDKTGFDGSTSILERKEARHFMSPKDLCTIDLLPEMVQAGIDSLKIEGRMKKPEYAAGVVSVYRACLDRAMTDPDHYRVSEEEHRILYDLYNRSGFTDGYFHRRNGPEMMALVKHELTKEETDARQRLYEEMHLRYMDEPYTVPVRARFTVRGRVFLFREPGKWYLEEPHGSGVDVLFRKSGKWYLEEPHGSGVDVLFRQSGKRCGDLCACGRAPCTGSPETAAVRGTDTRKCHEIRRNGFCHPVC